MPSAALIHPCRAPVAPRARRLPDGEILPLEQIVRQFIDHHERGIIHLDGPAGSGKTTALSHLAATLRDRNVILIDEPWPTQPVAHAEDALLIVVATHGLGDSRARVQLAPWSEDDLIEYLLAMHPQQCASVLARLKLDDDRARLGGLPQLCRMVLDEFAVDESLKYVASAVRRHVLRVLEHESCTKAALQFSMRRLKGEAVHVELPHACASLLRHRFVQLLLSAEQLADLLSSARERDELENLPRDLIREVALLVRSRSSAQGQLEQLVNRSGKSVSTAASILAAIDPTWQPRMLQINLIGATLERVHWAGIDLSGSDLSQTELRMADLSGANLSAARARGASFRNAKLRRAKMPDIDAQSADFAHADLAVAHMDRASCVGANLESANLEGAMLRGADLTGAKLNQACLAGADLSRSALVSTTLQDADLTRADLSEARLEHVVLSDARLSGARLREARMTRCDLENLEAADVDFSAANLSGSLLTGSILPNVNFRDADLRKTGLADVDWEGADLRGADLRGATFHLGSSRSGLVGSIIPCEGSKTGFYTDEFNEQDYKSPEEIRKANLCGADLRGARIKGVDFYLVDLRGARYTKKQARYFRRCGAILDFMCR